MIFLRWHQVRRQAHRGASNPRPSEALGARRDLTDTTKAASVYETSRSVPNPTLRSSDLRIFDRRRGGASPTPSPPLSLDALDLDGTEENDLDLECVVCCELYDTSLHAPMVLPCSGAHEICRTCVAALRKADGAIQCPKCREDATGAVNPNRGLIAALRLTRRS